MIYKALSHVMLSRMCRPSLFPTSVPKTNRGYFPNRPCISHLTGHLQRCSTWCLWTYQTESCQVPVAHGYSCSKDQNSSIDTKLWNETSIISYKNIILKAWCNENYWNAVWTKSGPLLWILILIWSLLWITATKQWQSHFPCINVWFLFLRKVVAEVHTVWFLLI
jgi:hypothetical protein